MPSTSKPKTRQTIVKPVPAGLLNRQVFSGMARPNRGPMLGFAAGVPASTLLVVRAVALTILRLLKSRCRISSPWQKWSFSASVADAWKEGLRLCFEEHRTQGMAAALPSAPSSSETLPERLFEPLEGRFLRPQAPGRARSELLTQY